MSIRPSVRLSVPGKIFLQEVSLSSLDGAAKQACFSSFFFSGDDGGAKQGKRETRDSHNQVFGGKGVRPEIGPSGVCANSVRNLRKYISLSGRQQENGVS